MKQYRFLILFTSLLLFAVVACAQTNVKVDQGEFVLTKHVVNGNEIIKAPKDSLYYAKDAVIVTKGGTPIQKAGRTVYMQVYDGSQRLFTITQSSKGTWKRSPIDLLLPYIMGPTPIDTLGIFIHWPTTREVTAQFLYWPGKNNTPGTVLAATPFEGRLQDCGKMARVTQHALTYTNDLIVISGESEEYMYEHVPAVYWLYTESKSTGENSVRIWFSEYDMAFTYGNSHHIAAALRENGRIQTYIDNNARIYQE